MTRIFTLFMFVSGTMASSLRHLTQETHPNIVGLAVATPELSTLVTALKAGDLVETLSGQGPFTVFAPTNEAFSKLPTSTLNHLLEPENKEELVNVLTYHVAAGNVQSKDLRNGQCIKTLQGKKLRVHLRDGGVDINNAKVVQADVEASNGVVHVIDSVLLP